MLFLESGTWAMTFTYGDKNSYIFKAYRTVSHPNIYLLRFCIDVKKVASLMYVMYLIYTIQGLYSLKNAVLWV